MSLKVDNGTVSAIVDGNAVLTRNFNGDLGELVQVQLDFRGSAKVDNFSIYENGVQRVFEDFNTTGQTTAQLVTSTGYLISTGLT